MPRRRRRKRRTTRVEQFGSNQPSNSQPSNSQPSSNQPSSTQHTSENLEKEHSYSYGSETDEEEDDQDDDEEEGDDDEDGVLQAPARWMWNYSNLCRFKKKMGHSSPTYRFSSRQFPRLGRWVNTQRHNRDGLNAYQIAQLDDLGFNWTPDRARTTTWDDCCDNLQAYIDEYGSVDVPDKFSTKKHPSLGNWLRIQKEAWTNELSRLAGQPPKTTRRLSISKRHRLLRMGVKV